MIPGAHEKNDLADLIDGANHDGVLSGAMRWTPPETGGRES